MSRTRLLSTAQICELFDLSHQTIYRWVREGWVEPDARTVGGHMRWDPDRFEQQMDRIYRERREGQ